MKSAPLSAPAMEFRPGQFHGIPRLESLSLEALEGADAVVHLAGENIAAGRWTAERKRRILESRRLGTRLLASSLSRLSAPPRVLISASAIGYYGDRGEEVLKDNSRPGQGFLADVCREWEEPPDRLPKEASAWS